MKIYIAGKCSGEPDFGRAKFAEAADRIKAMGHEPVNPAENFGGRTDLPRSRYMRRGFEQLLEVDGIALLDNWYKSPGATIEYGMAKELQIPAFRAEDMSPFKETVLEEANRLIYGPRQESYGPPKQDFQRTADFWSILFGCEIKAHHIPLAMICLKISREMNAHNRDNCVDIPGYAGTLQMLYDEI